MDRRRFMMFAAGVFPLAGCALPSLAFSQAPSNDGDEKYKPLVGQPGKDVVWVPTPDALVRRMLEQAKTGPEDLVFDLGCGDGKIPIAAAKLFGAIAKGIEYEADLAALARRNAERAGVADKVEIITGDIFDPALQQRFMRATVITLYLLPHLNLKLRPALLAMRPGTRIVSHAFHMGEWEPDETIKVEERDAYYWVVPTDAAGRWTLRADNGWEGVVDLTQRFQRAGGTLRIGTRTQPLLGAAVNGDQLGFTYVDGDERVKSLRASIKGDRLEGVLRYSPGLITSIKGQRTPNTG